MEVSVESATITAVLHELQPMIMGHGGSIDFVKYENNIVYVKLHGACSSCPASMFTLKLGLQEAIQAKIPAVKDVVALDE